MYKTSILVVKLDAKTAFFNYGSKNLDKVEKQIEDYINNFSKEGWDLISMTKVNPGIFGPLLFVWKKR